MTQRSNNRRLALLPGQSGYTLIELVLAIAVFSFMLLIIVNGYLNVFRIYQNGLASRDTQQNGRIGMEELVRAVREAKDIRGVATAGDFDYVCLELPNGYIRKLMVFIPGGDTYQAMYVVTAPPGPGLSITNCGGLNPTSAGAVAQKLTSNNVEVVEFKPVVVNTVAPSGNQSVQLVVKVATHNPSGSIVGGVGATHKSCDAVSGSQFCSISVYQSSATVRGKDAL
jgi:prepilin-type N-terminal cleavage/methylation domain-containing protein